MIINCDQPDLLLVYIGGGAGRAIIHQIMLSPEVHSWSPILEDTLQDLPIHLHANAKLEFFKQTVFPVALTNNHKHWKRYEPNPWDANFEHSKLFIRHEWVRETFDYIAKYQAKKVAYTNYESQLDFCVNAAIQKKAKMIVSTPNGEDIATWSARPAAEVAAIVSEQKLQALSSLSRWKLYQKDFGLHEVSLEKLYFGTDEEFLSEYYALCNYYEVTPVGKESLELRNHWKSLHTC